MSEIPIYIPSKGRARIALTPKYLDAMGKSYLIIVEEQEWEDYARAFGEKKLVLLDKSYQERYDMCDEQGGYTPTPETLRKCGAGPARNFAWDHSMERGAKWHWVMDDNINGFYRYHFNLKTPCVAPTFWTAMEEFAARFENVVMAGPNYFMFVSRKSGNIPPYTKNTRVFSCNLIRNDMADAFGNPIRWRGRHNEDVTISLDALYAGHCTLLYNAFLQYKMPTQTFKGGMTDQYYAVEGTKPKSEFIANMFPDIATVSFKFGRWHHHVDYGVFKRRQLRYRPGFEVPAEAVDNYGMQLQQQVDGRWIRIDRPRPERVSRYAPSPGDEKIRENPD